MRIYLDVDDSTVECSSLANTWDPYIMVAHTLQFHVEAEDQNVCWICLEGSSAGELLSPCKCPSRFVHRHCLARWQLHSAGRDEERSCRFCHQVLPDWKPALTPQDLQPASSVMSVKYRGVTHYITYTPGPDSTKHFMAELARLGIQMATPKNITFLCRAPDTGSELSLKGMEAFDAAAYCASISAARRRKSQCESQPDSTVTQHPGADTAATDTSDQGHSNSSSSTPPSSASVDGAAGVHSRLASGSNSSTGTCTSGYPKLRTFLKKVLFWK